MSLPSITGFPTFGKLQAHFPSREAAESFVMRKACGVVFTCMASWPSFLCSVRTPSFAFSGGLPATSSGCLGIKPTPLPTFTCKKEPFFFFGPTTHIFPCGGFPWCGWHFLDPPPLPAWQPECSFPPPWNPTAREACRPVITPPPLQSARTNGFPLRAKVLFHHDPFRMLRGEFQGLFDVIPPSPGLTGSARTVIGKRLAKVFSYFLISHGGSLTRI